ncbi:MAG: sulfite exporter TauE/SafE family protein [Coriobacteriia bacterium]|nr:sulfite exporter TauE/SafE family protein [Coriobacteriia bacterium]
MEFPYIVSMLVLGLGTSLHCVSMCGPLVLTYAVKADEDGPWYRRLTPNFAYQGAKIVSYMLVGLLLGALGAFINFDALRPYVMYLAGAFMIVLGLGMTGKVRWAARFNPRPPRFVMTALMKLRRKANSDAEAGEGTLATPVMFGLLTGLLPCGPLMAAQVTAAASGSAATGALGMAAFGLGTAPLMIAFGTAGSMIPRVWKERMMMVLAVGVIIFGLVFINRGLMLTGAPVNFNSVKAAVLGGPIADAGEYTKGADGVVEIPLVIENVQFVPAAIQIPADTPVRIMVDRREDSACSDQVALPQLGVLVDVAPFAVTAVELPAAKAGTYTLTCGMGMMSGQLIVGGGGGGASGASPLLWLLAAGIAAGAALWVANRRDRRLASPSGASIGPNGSAQHARSAPAQTEQPSGFLGFNPTEVIIIAVAIGAAIFAGMALGGMFN